MRAKKATDSISIFKIVLIIILALVTLWRPIIEIVKSFIILDILNIR